MTCSRVCFCCAAACEIFVILPSREFDREKHSSYSFEVFATDGGEYGPRTEKVRVEITIRDVNDNAPVFEQVPFKAEVPPTFPIQGLVTEVGKFTVHELKSLV